MEVPGNFYMLTTFFFTLQMGTDPGSRGRVRFGSNLYLNKCHNFNICILEAVMRTCCPVSFLIY